MQRVENVSAQHAFAPSETLLDRLNGLWHERALRVFTVIVLAHFAEHIVQAFQVYYLRWPVPEARGIVGLWLPWLIKSEALHYGYALVMLVGLWIFRTGFVGTGRLWWNIALGIQVWHHFEHALLQGQAILGQNLAGRPVPMSVAQFFIPRVELHLIYNTAVLIPMVVAMYYHLLPSAADRAKQTCTCAAHSWLAPTGATSV